MRHRAVALLLVFVFAAIWDARAWAHDAVSCAVCGMPIKAGAKAGFEAVKDGKTIHLCSFPCAHAFHKKYRDIPLVAHDFVNGEKLDTRTAYFLIKSENILKQLEFGMAPTVVAFNKEKSAKETQAQMKDGEVVKGYDALETIYR